MLVLALLLTATSTTNSPDGQFRYSITERNADSLVLVRAVGPKNAVVGRFTIRGTNVEARFATRSLQLQPVVAPQLWHL